MKSGSCALIALLLALILGGAYYYYAQKSNQSNKNNNSAQEENTPKADTGQGSNISMVEPTKITLSDVSGGEGHGIANRIYANQQFIHTVTAQLPALSNSNFYNGWLAKQNNGNWDYIDSGKMQDSNGEFYLEFRSDTDYSTYSKVVISLQDKTTSAPEKPILEGEFK